MSEKKHLPNGKTLSKRIGQRSKASHGAPSAKLQRLLTSIFNDYQSIPDPAIRDQVRHAFVFHMTDWAGDLEHLADLYKHPEAYTKAQAGQVVAGFLYHALGHVRAAGQLLLDYDVNPFAARRKTPLKRS